jgi:hypothetical protein
MHGGGEVKTTKETRDRWREYMAVGQWAPSDEMVTDLLDDADRCAELERFVDWANSKLIRPDVHQLSIMQRDAALARVKELEEGLLLLSRVKAACGLAGESRSQRDAVCGDDCLECLFEDIDRACALLNPKENDR